MNFSESRSFKWFYSCLKLRRSRRASPTNLVCLALCFIFFGCDAWTGGATFELSSVSSGVEEEHAELNAFPGAEGFGRYAEGGRGGDVYHVTNLSDDDDNPSVGSLRYGLENQDGPRTIVFDISGTIELKDTLRITDSYLTIAGQTAPGDGITLKDYGVRVKGTSDEDIHDLIIRYIRVRLGDENKGTSSGEDNFTVKNGSDIIFDHLSAGWGIDAIQDTDEVKNYTLQWSIFGETLHNSIHYEGGGHSKLMSFRDCTGNISLHHNLLHSTHSRHPTLGGGIPDAILDMRNNLIYNSGGQTNMGGSQTSVINNYYKAGYNTRTGIGFLPLRVKTKQRGDGYPMGFVSGNVFPWNSDFTDDNFSAVKYQQDGDGSYLSVTQEEWALPNEIVFGDDKPTTTSAEVAMEVILASAGASKSRDSTDARIINEVETTTGRVIDSQDEVGGWPVLNSLPTPLDSDQDGMPDSWESSNGLDINNASDRNDDRNGDGYTNLEEYLNGLVSEEPVTETNDDFGIDAFSIIEAEDYDVMDGIRTQESSEGTLNIGWIDAGEWIAFKDVDFGGGATEFEARVARRNGSISLRLDSVDGPEIGTLNVTATDGSQVYETQSTAVSDASGVHDLYLVFGGSGFNLNWFTFRGRASLQAEDAILRRGAEAEQNHAGYRGSGFVNFPSNKGNVKFKRVDGGDGGSATLTIRYANGGGDRSGRLVVNGARQSLTMESTGAWDNWVSKAIPIELNPGTSNVIKIKSTGSDFGNLDEISISH